MASYPSQCKFNQQEQQLEEQKRNEPRPLRIVKRHRSIDSRRDEEEHTHTSGADSDSEVASITAETQRLHIFKRRSRRHDSATGEALGSSMVDVSSASKKAWSEAVASCRGLLRKSTPDMKNYRRFLSFGQTSSSYTSCSSRYSSLDSSHHRGSIDDGLRRRCRRHLSSISSCEPDYVGAGAPVSGNVQQQRWTSDLDFACGRQIRQDGTSQQLSPRQMAKNTGGYILSPRIVVTAHNEDRLGENACISSSSASSSSSSSATRSCSRGEKTHGESKSSGTFVNHKIDRYFDFGCLYDLTAEVQSTQDATVVEVIQEQSWPTTIYAGTSVLLIVHLRLHGTNDKGAQGHSRCRSEELIEELELQLGDTRTQLLHVKISYLHSAFPTIDNARSTKDGLCHLESRMETTATAALVPRCKDSVWASRTRGASSSSSSSSSSSLSSSPQRSLFPLMVQHWGDEKAIDVQRRISDSQMMFHRPHQLDFGCPNEKLVVPDQHVADSRWKVWSGQGTGPLQSAEEEIKTPVRDIYYFGERAIKALKSPSGNPTSARYPAGLRRDEFRRISSTNEHKRAAEVEAKEKDLKFWDWGKWF
ncbi:hypothetical protein E4U21_004580 [Claviceps maximensis]|nr:hypothetical protein E4U21_004580 [Claviceps maximensis]